ncbi:MAG: hypothetical protein MPEBLZ_04072, partial [Candidatus Methanoperedens nitroreducens]
RAGSGSKLEDVSVREVKMGESGH